mmetsp:Transcript_24686/g.74100  ORF Transcript_24686/g.74100 Transcript_24686/m.74100 type:complete len:113 (-) Transcript_24686:34-372(-)
MDGPPEEETMDKKMINRDNMMWNHSAIDGVRSYLIIFAAVATGIVGATSLQGLACFVGAYVAISLALLLRMRGDSERYMDLGVAHMVLGGAGGYALSFVLFWTLAYALVHIY